MLFLDDDADEDGLLMPVDNCPGVANAGQEDADGSGDPCDVGASSFDPDQLVRPSDAAPEVALDLEFTGASSLQWSEASGVVWYNQYRGTFGAGGAWTFDHGCLAPGLAAPEASDASSPTAGTGFYYLVSGDNACGEGVLETGSTGNQRSTATPCVP